MGARSIEKYSHHWGICPMKNLVRLLAEDFLPGQAAKGELTGSTPCSQTGRMSDPRKPPAKEPSPGEKPVPLIHADSLEGPANTVVTVLHGLFGSGRNWQQVARLWQQDRPVWLPDARNHGQSFHAPNHTYHEMATDLKNLVIGRKIKRPFFLVGHSMGGLSALTYAGLWPEDLAGLVVADIAPRNYPPGFEREFAALRALKDQLPNLENREEMDQVLAAHIPTPAIRQFLASNVRTVPGTRDESPRFEMRLGLDALYQSYRSAVFEPLQNSEGKHVFQGPVLFIKGEKSPFITAEDEVEIQRLFPRSRLETIAGAGHWLHYSHRERFVELTRDFFASA